jgi:hypothetical protein
VTSGLSIIETIQVLSTSSVTGPSDFDALGLKCTVLGLAVVGVSVSVATLGLGISVSGLAVLCLSVITPGLELSIFELAVLGLELSLSGLAVLGVSVITLVLGLDMLVF